MGATQPFLSLAKRFESKIGMDVFLSDDAKEGPLAFMQKRKPEFQGR